MSALELETIYRRRRAEFPYMSAVSAAQYARWLLEEPRLEKATGDLPFRFTVESEELEELETAPDSAGFTLSVRADYDYDSSPTDWLGSFTDEEYHYDSSEGKRVIVHHERNPRAWYLSTWKDFEGKERAELERDRGQYAYVSLESGFRYSDAYEWARSAGMARSVADEYARARVTEDVALLTSEEYAAAYIVVTASREGIELGSASLGGYELSTDWRDGYAMNQRWMSETALELMGEAISDAIAALERLCSSSSSRTS